MDAGDPRRIINYRPLFLNAVGFISGLALIGAYRSLELPAWVSCCILAFGLAAVVLISVLALRARNRFVIVLVFAALLGAARMSISIPDSVREGEYRVTGTVFSVSESDKTVVTLSGAKLNGIPMRYRIKLETGEVTPEIGDLIETVCTVKVPTMRFGTYDERLALLANGISLKAKCDELSVISKGNLPLWRGVCDMKQMLRARIFELFPDNASIVAGFLLGERTGMDEADVDCFTATGTAHLLTLSGFHVGLITAILFFLLPKRFPWLRFGIVTLFLLFYCSITAFAPSLVRASIMCICVMTADAAERRADTLSSLSLAALIILVISPYKIYSVGFRLSFAATFGILLFTRAGTGRTRNRAINYLVGLATVTLAATISTVLFTANAFGVIQTYGLLSNLTAVPIFSVAVMISFVALLAGVPFPAVGKLIAWPADNLVTEAMRVLARIQSLPYSQIEVFSPSSFTAVLMLVLMFAVSAYVLRPIGKRMRIATPLLFLFTASVFADIIRV